jgi:putative long chain acyl-CoA synthase
VTPKATHVAVESTRPGSKLGPTHAGYATQAEHAADRFVRGVFDRRDAWFLTSDIVRRDADGDYWYVDRTQHLLRGPHGWVASREIEDRLHTLAGLEYAVVVGLAPERIPLGLRERVASSTDDVVVAILVVREPERFDPRPLSACVSELRPEQRPSFVCLRTSIALTDGFRPLKAPIVAAGIDPADPWLLLWDPELHGYRNASSSA